VHNISVFDTEMSTKPEEKERARRQQLRRLKMKFGLTVNQPNDFDSHRFVSRHRRLHCHKIHAPNLQSKYSTVRRYIKFLAMLSGQLAICKVLFWNFNQLLR